MAMPERSRNRKLDLNKLAKRIVDDATGERKPEPAKDSLAVELGRRGGLKGGKVRAERVTPEQRSAAA